MLASLSLPGAPPEDGNDLCVCALAHRVCRAHAAVVTILWTVFSILPRNTRNTREMREGYLTKEPKHRGEMVTPQLVEPAVTTAIYFSGARAEASDGSVHVTLWVEQRDFSEPDAWQAVIVGRLICSAEAAVQLGLSLQHTMADVLMRDRESGHGGRGRKKGGDDG